jgi:hypothetical protein
MAQGLVLLVRTADASTLFSNPPCKWPNVEQFSCRVTNLRLLHNSEKEGAVAWHE